MQFFHVIRRKRNSIVIRNISSPSSTSNKESCILSLGYEGNNLFYCSIHSLLHSREFHIQIWYYAVRFSSQVQKVQLSSAKYSDKMFPNFTSTFIKWILIKPIIIVAILNLLNYRMYNQPFFQKQLRLFCLLSSKMAFYIFDNFTW